MYRYLAVSAIFLCRPAAAQPSAPAEAAVSTQPAAATATRPANGALLLNIDKNRDYSRVGFDYSLRWDFKDIASLRPGPGLIIDGVKALVSWDITKNTRVNYYGLRTNPWRLILSDEEKAAAGGGNGNGGAAAGTAARAQARKRRLRLSLSPLAEDVRVGIREDLGDIILKASSSDPTWQKAGKQGRKAFVQDVLSLGIWDAPVPVIRESRAGLEYLSKPPK